jgi:acylpyruvate hydrolase
MKIICVGRNYAAHAKELNNKVEDQPVIFMKPETALIAARQPFFYPDFSNDVHHEVELVVRIKKTGKRIEERFAKNYYDDITLGIDFTARDLQQQLKAKGLPWELAKSFDNSAPVGNFLSVNEHNLTNLSFSLRVNGEIRQQGNTSSMIFSVDRIISFVSRYVTLKKGDLIFTGTPEGVGPVHKGDNLEAFIEEHKVLSVKIR